MNKKNQSFFSKFKFKYWSWELDFIKIVPSIFIMLVFLPILPHEKNNDKLISVLGIEASVDSFYSIGSMILIRGDNDKKDDLLKGEAFSQLNKLMETPIPNTIKHKEYLINKGVSIELAKCITFRDFLLYNYFMDNEMRILLNQYPPSPVPMIWITRILIKYLLDLISTTSIRFEGFNEFSEVCANFENMGPPIGYLEEDFGYTNQGGFK